MPGNFIEAVGIHIAIMSGGGTLINVGAVLAISLVPGIAPARVRPDGLVDALGFFVTNVGILRALVHVDGAGGSGPVQLSVGGGTDTRIVTGPGLLLAFAIDTWVGVAVVGRHRGGSGRPRRRGLRRGGGEGRGRTGRQRCLGT